MADMARIRTLVEPLWAATVVPVEPPIEEWAKRLLGKKMITEVKMESNTGCEISNVPGCFQAREVNGSPLRDVPRSDAHVSLLLGLPIEIPLCILEEALAPTEVAGDPYSRWIHNTSIIFTCKQLFVEARSIALEKNIFKRSELPQRRYLDRGYPLRHYITLRDR